MNKVYMAVKNSIIKQLAEIFSDTDIYSEEIPQTKVQVGDYFFISLIPISTETVNKYFTKVSIFIDVISYLVTETNVDYLLLSADLDNIFRPVFDFEDRAITVNSATTKIVDGVLHYIFSLNFTVSKEVTEDSDLMQELDSNFQI